MKHKIIFFLFTGLFFTGLSSFISTPVPDPDSFGKEFIETIKKKSREAYISKYAVTKEDFAWLQKEISANQYVNEELKESYLESMLKDTSINTKIREKLSGNYDAVEYWIKKDTIDLSQVSYIRTFYTMSYYSTTPFNVLGNGIIFIKHKTNYYKLEIAQAAFINNKWVYGENLRITKVDKYINRIQGEKTVDTYDEVAYDSVAVVIDTTMAVAYDTTGMVEDSYYSDEMVIDNNANRYSGLNPKQAKKIEKMQKQIDALYIKMDKEYSKEY